MYDLPDYDLIGYDIATPIREFARRSLVLRSAVSDTLATKLNLPTTA